MNVFLAIVRRIALFGIIFSLIYLIVKHSIPNGIVLLVMFGVYFIFSFFTWLSARHSTSVVSKAVGMDIPKKGFGETLGRVIFLDLISPLASIVDAIRIRESFSVVLLVFTYCIMLTYVILWFVLA